MAIDMSPCSQSGPNRITSPAPPACANMITSGTNKMATAVMPDLRHQNPKSLGHVFIIADNNEHMVKVRELNLVIV